MYHMYGSQIGSLAVEIKGNTGGWVEVWRRARQQQASDTAAWVTAHVMFSSAVTQVRFNATTGTGYKGDIALANVELLSGRPGLCCMCVLQWGGGGRAQSLYVTPPPPAPPPAPGFGGEWAGGHGAKRRSIFLCMLS